MGLLKERRWQEEIKKASKVIYESETTKSEAPQINTTLRSHALTVPEEIGACSGIVVFGKRIQSLVYTTDIAIIRNVNADAIFAVYPFSPQPIISEMLIHAADVPVFTGVGGGTTQGKRVVHLGQFAEMQGASGVVVNSPTQNINVAAGSKTPKVVSEIRKINKNIPIIATGGPTRESIKATVAAGANAIIWTPPSCSDIFGELMDAYREKK